MIFTRLSFIFVKFIYLKDIGFVTIKNHGLPDNIVEKVFAASKELFALPSEVKAKYPYTSAEANRGYLGAGAEKLDGLRGDMKETFEMGNENDKEYLNYWPSELPTCNTYLLFTL